MIVERIIAHRQVSDEPAPSGSFVPLPKVVCGGLVPKLPRIDALMIDVGGVVYDDTSWWRWLVQLMTHAGVRVRHDVLSEDWESEYLRHSERDNEAFWNALRKCLMRWGLTAGCCDEVQAAAIAQQKHWEATLHAFHGVDVTLGDLAQQGIPMIGVADASCSRQICCDGSTPCLSRPSSTRRSPRAIPVARCWTHRSTDRRSAQSLAGAAVALISSKPRHLHAAHLAGLTTIAVNCIGHFRADLCLGHVAALPRQLSYQCGRQAA
jgi:hypothetical protein